MPVRKPKCPEGRLYSGLIRSKSDDMLAGFGDSRTASFVLNGGKFERSCVVISLEKMATCDFGPVTVISGETLQFFVYIWIISWDATNRSLIQHLGDH